MNKKTALADREAAIHAQRRTYELAVYGLDINDPNYYRKLHEPCTNCGRMFHRHWQPGAHCPANGSKLFGSRQAETIFELETQ